MRILFLIMLVAGVGLGIVYPFAMSNFAGREIGRYTAYERQGGFRPVNVDLAPGDAPVRVLVDMASTGAMVFDGATTALTLTASVDGRTVLAEALAFAHQQPRSDNPQTGGMVYRDDAGLIDPVESGTYRFVLGPGDMERIEMRSAEIVLRAGGIRIDPRAIPAGYGLMAIGFIGFVLSLRRRRKVEPAAPPPPKWGR